MSESEPKQENQTEAKLEDVINECQWLNLTESDLKKDGWEEAYSFRGRDSKHILLALDKIKSLKATIWQLGISRPDSEAQRHDGIYILWKKESEEYKKIMQDRKNAMRKI